MGNNLTSYRSKIFSPAEVLPPKKTIRVMKSDGKVLKYRKPILVEDLLTKFNDFVVSSTKDASQCLPSGHKLKIGKMYHLVPVQARISPSNGRNISLPQEEGEQDGVKRIKVVVTKQQLQELLSQKLSVEEMLLGLREGSKGKVNSPRSWRPELESIPEESLKN